jgi:hypothetical protein
MSGDLRAPWQGDLTFDSTGDFAFVEGQDHSTQRVLRRLLTNPAQYDSNGDVLLPADDKFNMDYGVGLGRAIDETDSVDLRRFLAAKTREGLAQEATVDQAVAPVIEFGASPRDGALFMSLEYQTIQGQITQTGIRF